MTFDWAQIAYIGSPLVTPWWAAANVVIGLVIVMWIVAPLMCKVRHKVLCLVLTATIPDYKNTLYSAFMPMLSSAVFDDTGKPYDVSRILTSKFLFDHEAYEKYSKVYLPITYVLAYGVQFAGLSALVTHTACWHGRDIWRETRRSFGSDEQKRKTEYSSIRTRSPQSSFEDPAPSLSSTIHTADLPSSTSIGSEDVHNRLMRQYEDAPLSWYLSTFAVMLAIGIFLVE